jgi:hypothetical protein
VRHVVSTSWLALAVVAGSAGVFALAGESMIRFALGGDYGGDVGAELGRLVVYLTPWMVASIGASATFPLLFVAGRSRLLPLLSAAALAFHVPAAVLGREAFGLPGVALALAASTAVLLAGLLVLLSSEALLGVARGLGAASVWTAGLAAACYLGLSLVLPPLAAAAAGTLAYTSLLLALRPRGLREAWSYVRALA